MNCRIRGVNYHVEIAGTGEPLLLLHGFTGSTATWRPAVAGLADRFRVMMIDELGHGQTDCPPNPARYTMEEAAADLAAILDAYGFTRAHVLGYSMGGRLALGFACLYPRRVGTLILESASPGLRTAAERMQRRTHDNRLAKRVLKEGIPAFVDRWEAIPLFMTQRRLPQSMRQAVRAERLGQCAAGLAGSLRGMGTGMQPSWWDRLTALRMPVLLISGERDEKFCRIAAEMDDRLAHARRSIIPDAGHNTHIEKADAFVQTVRPFLIDHLLDPGHAEANR